MKLNIDREWLESFSHDEPRGYATLHDRDAQAQHQAEAAKIVAVEVTRDTTRKQKRRTEKAQPRPVLPSAQEVSLTRHHD